MGTRCFVWFLLIVLIVVAWAPRAHAQTAEEARRQMVLDLPANWRPPRDEPLWQQREREAGNLRLTGIILTALGAACELYAVGWLVRGTGFREHDRSAAEIFALIGSPFLAVGVPTWWVAQHRIDEARRQIEPQLAGAKVGLSVHF